MLNFREIKKEKVKKTARKTTGQRSTSFLMDAKTAITWRDDVFFDIIYCTIGSIHILNSNSNTNSNPTLTKKYRCSDRINACLLKETTVSVLQCKSALKLYALTSKCGLMYVWGCMLFCATHTHKKNHNIPYGDSSNLYALSQHIYHFVSTWWQYKPKTALWCVCMYVFAGMLTCCSIYFLAILQCITTYTRFCIN